MTIQQPFALWITGLPASGKSSIAHELARGLRDAGITAIILESDEFRTLLTPHPVYSSEERDFFYHALANIGAIVIRQGISVIFDATANKRTYRDAARSLIPRFMEIYVSCPLDVCIARDPKGIYKNALCGGSSTVPGLNIPYEPPPSPWFTADCREHPAKTASRIIEELNRTGPDQESRNALTM